MTNAFIKMLLCAIIIALTTTAKAEIFTFTAGDQQYSKRHEKRIGKENICYGKKISPQLQWRGEPQGTQSFAITVYDADTTRARGRNHWTLFNIPADIHTLLKDSGNPFTKILPSGSIQSRNDFGSLEYAEICSDLEDAGHSFVFTVWAIPVKTLPIDENVSPAIARLYIRQHQIGRARFFVTSTQ